MGIPTQHERARQTVVRQALEPKWKAKLSPHTYGFRLGRSCWDAIGAIFLAIRVRPQYALKADIQKCFDRIRQADNQVGINASADTDDFTSLAV